MTANTDMWLQLIQSFKQPGGTFSYKGRKLIAINLLLVSLLTLAMVLTTSSTVKGSPVGSGVYVTIFLLYFSMYCGVSLAQLPRRIRYPLLAGLLLSQCGFLIHALNSGGIVSPLVTKTFGQINLLLGTILLLVAGTSWLRETNERSIGDKLTGLFNHRYFEIAVEHYLNSQHRHNNPSCLLSLDIDNFKEINSKHGHDHGDLVISLVADVLKETTRASDVVCRSGSEEFEALLVGSNITNAREVGNRIQSGIKSHTPENSDELTASIGITSIIPSDDIRSLRQRVDKAIGCAKQSGKAQVVTV